MNDSNSKNTVPSSFGNVLLIVLASAAFVFVTLCFLEAFENNFSSAEMVNTLIKKFYELISVFSTGAIL